MFSRAAIQHTLNIFYSTNVDKSHIPSKEIISANIMRQHGMGCWTLYALYLIEPINIEHIKTKYPLTRLF